MHCRNRWCLHAIPGDAIVKGVVPAWPVDIGARRRGGNSDPAGHPFQNVGDARWVPLSVRTGVFLLFVGYGYDLIVRARHASPLQRGSQAHDLIGEEIDV